MNTKNLHFLGYSIYRWVQKESYEYDSDYRIRKVGNTDTQRKQDKFLPFLCLSTNTYGGLQFLTSMKYELFSCHLSMEKAI